MILTHDISKFLQYVVIHWARHIVSRWFARRWLESGLFCEQCFSENLNACKLIGFWGFFKVLCIRSCTMSVYYLVKLLGQMLYDKDGPFFQGKGKTVVVAWHNRGCSVFWTEHWPRKSRAYCRSRDRVIALRFKPSKEQIFLIYG